MAGVSILASLAAGSLGASANDSTVKAVADANQWAVAGHDYANTRYSPLNQINADNVGKLTLAYSFSLASLRSNESSPVIIGDTLYVTTSWGPKYVYALDAATGARKWTYEPEIPDDVLQYACCDVNNRGVAYADGKLYIGRLDGKLTALDAKTGKELWTTKVVDYKQGSVITSPPLIVRDKVITGFGGGEYGVRGALQAFDVNTGKQIWQTFTTPAPGEPASDTWKGDTGLHGGGAPWLVGSYDAKTDTVYWGTSNPGPWNTGVRSTGDGNFGKLSNLYTSSTLALDPNTGSRRPQDGRQDRSGHAEGRSQRLLLRGQSRKRQAPVGGKIRSFDQLGQVMGRQDHARGRGSRQASGSGAPGEGHLPEPDRR